MSTADELMREIFRQIDAGVDPMEALKTTAVAAAVRATGKTPEELRTEINSLIDKHLDEAEDDSIDDDADDEDEDDEDEEFALHFNKIGRRLWQARHKDLVITIFRRKKQRWKWVAVDEDNNVAWSNTVLTLDAAFRECDRFCANLPGE